MMNTAEVPQTIVQARLKLSNPIIESTPERSFAGIRVAGPDTDLELTYWNGAIEDFMDPKVRLMSFPKDIKI